MGIGEVMAVKNCPKCNSKGLGGYIRVGHPNGMNTIKLHIACCSNPDCEYGNPDPDHPRYYSDYDKWQNMERKEE